jgi:uncharacterized membrane protein YeaQ/YmgE (transglycosylase-associated protein family)
MAGGWPAPGFSGRLSGHLESQNVEDTTMWLLWVILVGLIAGWAAGKIMKGTGYGTLGDIVLGILGGIVGGWLVRLFGFYPAGGLISSIVTAIIGAVVLVAIVRTIKKA